MQKDNVTPGELAQARALLSQIPLAESNQETIANGLLGPAQIGLPLDVPHHAAKLYFGMNQVRAAFAKWIRPDGFVKIVRGPASH